MLFERIESEDLAHYSYLIGDNRPALVINPRRHVDIYIARTAQTGYRPAYILETHRNTGDVGRVDLPGAACPFHPPAGAHE